MKEKITSGTIARTVILFLALLNQCLSMAGVQVIPIEDEVINALVSNTWTVVAALIAWWKNNSFTQPAIKADKSMKSMKG